MYYNCLDEKEISAISGLDKIGDPRCCPPLVWVRAVIIDIGPSIWQGTLLAAESISRGRDHRRDGSAQVTGEREGDIRPVSHGWTDGMMEADQAPWGRPEPGLNNEGAVLSQR